MNKISFPKELFSLRAVKIAADSFSKICHITVAENPTQILCEVDMKAPVTFHIAMQEFENYLIDLTVSGGYYVGD